MLVMVNLQNGIKATKLRKGSSSYYECVSSFRDVISVDTYSTINNCHPILMLPVNPTTINHFEQIGVAAKF